MNKKLGVLGGMGPMATVDFVRRVVEKSPASSDQEHMAMIISNNPVTPDRTDCILNNGEDPLNTMLNNLMSLKESGATKVVIPCNTAHYWLDKLDNSNVSFISIIETVLNEARRREMTRIGVMATDATIKTGIYADAIAANAMEAMIPTDSEQKRVMEGIYAVKAGNIAKGKMLMEPVFDRLIARGAQGVILGCTEIPLAFDDMEEYKKAISLDSLDLLADQCVKYYYHDK
ncbi:aspartate racemase [Vibrio sp. MACH09]|uniref:aspartate/glutamate racemase family protein n=1 Tax=unclassified Vibrio TaxID=2614977 RepID=UPI00149334EC|nr:MULTISPECIES: amino acid racemase [unclassified Vibrio]NOI65276.1 aspartate/glutamate racemase family protein [Vibrio sp. 99-8-1]GLO60733.1 aspartate racemase [Vibrio sp. MACH09]